MPFAKAARAGAYLAAHVLVACLIIGAISLIKLLIVEIGDPLLFDWVPIRYVFDAMDAGILISFALFGAIEAFNVFRER